MERWGFCGPSAELPSVNEEIERSINLMPQVVDSGTPKKTPTLDHTPGLKWRETLGTGPVRGLYSEDGRAWAISGVQYYELFAHAPAILRGTVALDGNLTSTASNGVGGGQLLTLSGGKGFIYNLSADTVVAITDPDFPPNARQVAMLDGYFLVLNDANEFFLSALEDGLTWDALDVNQRSQVADKWQAMLRNHKEIWLLGSETTNVYIDSGDIDIPFEPVSGVLIEQGILAPFSAQRLDNTFVWVGRNEAGQGVVYRANGYTPERISTHGVEAFLATSRQLAKATAFTYQDAGHSFYQLHVPDLDTSWTFDVATHLWHERAHWDLVQLKFVPHRATTHCLAFGTHLVGDRLTGGIYEYRLDQYQNERVDA